MIGSKVRKLIGILRHNIHNTANVVFISEEVNWVIRDICERVKTHLQKDKQCDVDIAFSHFLLRNKILHFGSVSTITSGEHLYPIHASNKAALTWFHVEPDDRRIQHIPALNKRLSMVHTACETTKKDLIAHGFDAEKIVVVPLGIDLSVFHPATKESRAEARRALSLPDNAFVIGSFQKDGEGWGDGMTPKKVKGPDVFCDVVERVAKKHPVHVLLTGPARGYVKARLDKAGIPYTHTYLDQYEDIVSYYYALDAYLIASRVEGGPMAVLESWACGVPLVTTAVGMAADIAHHKKNAYVAKSEDVAALVSALEECASDHARSSALVEQGLQDVQQYAWSIVAKRYYDELYRPLL